MATDLYQGWDHRWLGTATMTLTDSNGPHVVSITTGTYCHLSLAVVEVDARDYAAIDTGFDDFATALQTAINAAATPLVYTVTFGATNINYEIESVALGNFTLTFAADAAGAAMRRILGFSASTPSTNLHTTDMRPWYVMRAEIDGRAAYTFPTARAGQIRSAIGDDASVYVLPPTRLVQTAKWEHRFEQPAHVHRRFADADTTVSGKSWTWQDWLDHAARYAVPCVIKDATESMVFRTVTPFEPNSARRRKPDVEPQQIVAIDATAIVGYL
jgi:hypothetical protein